VQSDNLIDAGILEKDYVVIRPHRCCQTNPNVSQSATVT